MTAIKGHVVGDTPARANNRDRRTPGASSERSLTVAKAKFMGAVDDGVQQLRQQCGYSYERATKALLRELGKSDFQLDDNEVSLTRLSGRRSRECLFLEEWRKHDGEARAASGATTKQYFGSPWSSTWLQYWGEPVSSILET